MRKPKYYCPKCKRNHYISSEIGKKHLPPGIFKTELPTKIINIKPVYEDKEYYCSENSTATLLNYYGSNVTPSELHERGCYHFNSIEECLPKFIKQKQSIISELQKSVDKHHPILVSVIPDKNVEKQEKHTILVVGYNNDSFKVIDKGCKLNVNYETFKRMWKRTKNNTYISKYV